MNPVLLRSLAPAPTRSWQRWAPTGALLLAAGLLTGCANVRTVEAQVQSYTRLAALPQPPSYRLELLPSQQAQAASFATIEQQAQQALAMGGLQRDDAQPRLLVQISAQARTTVPKDWPYYGPGGGRWGMGWGVGGRGGWGLGGWMMDRPPTLYERSVSILMRDAQTQHIVYETSATHEEVWSNDALIYGVLFDAALSGFPQPPSTARQVRSTMPLH